MGSARDGAPDPRRAGSSVCPPISAPAHVHPVSVIAPLAASTPGRTPPESCHGMTTRRGCYALKRKRGTEPAVAPHREKAPLR